LDKILILMLCIANLVRLTKTNSSRETV
jgi:hypothetical protein